MYQLSRLLLLTSVAALAYSTVVLAIVLWPYSGVFLVCVIVGRFFKKGLARFTTLGSARWADEADFRRAGVLNTNSGLILGRFPLPRSWLNGLLALAFCRGGARTACADFWAAIGIARERLIRLPNVVHTAVIAPSGAGKGQGFVLPHLLTCGDSCIVLDPKGENARLTAEHRQRELGQQTALLDPYRTITKTPATFNPLDFIDRNSPLALDDCFALAKALVIRAPDERDPHWCDGAEMFIAGAAAVVVYYGESGATRSLQQVREILSDPQKLDLAIKLMCESDAAAGMLARLGRQLTYFIDKEKASVLTTIARHLRFLDTLAVAESTQSSSFDPALLRAGKLTVFLILPPEFLRSQASLLRMWISSLLRAVVQGGAYER